MTFNSNNDILYIDCSVLVFVYCLWMNMKVLDGSERALLNLIHLNLEVNLCFVFTVFSFLFFSFFRLLLLDKNKLFTWEACQRLIGHSASHNFGTLYGCSLQLDQWEHVTNANRTLLMACLNIFFLLLTDTKCSSFCFLKDAIACIWKSLLIIKLSKNTDA